MNQPDPQLIGLQTLPPSNCVLEDLAFESDYQNSQHSPRVDPTVKCLFQLPLIPPFLQTCTFSIPPARDEQAVYHLHVHSPVTAWDSDPMCLCAGDQRCSTGTADVGVSCGDTIRACSVR